MLLTKANKDKFIWGPEQQRLFDTLINVLTNEPVFVLYDFNAEYEVHIVASSVGLAGLLLQSVDGSDWRPVCYYSRHYTVTENRYHSYELEVLAVVETLERFRVYLIGKQFRLVTDCSAVAHVKDHKELKTKIARRWLKLLEYDFECIHRSGSRLQLVDALSRIYILGALNEMSSYFGLPSQVVTDRGTSFTSKAFEDFCNAYNIQHTKVAVLTPRANGQAERANQRIEKFLRTTKENPKDWDVMLRNLQWSVNSRKNATTGFSPNELVFDFQLRDVVTNQMLAAIHEDVNEEQSRATAAEKRIQAAVNISTEREKWKQRFDQRHKENIRGRRSRCDRKRTSFYGRIQKA
ncbi:PREDICTED: uncharacterized protein LOC108366275 [Rhagoletis zephyria]|uniref:uncharacterized protein LOC108366275 n=1 Tax=Rhagoletis zephyria TaxID=28612 RepID=UPI0008113066|nr:PREDICTED: uncharacterized protein LOC108366275 [Rhagoletis zephyria]